MMMNDDDDDDELTHSELFCRTKLVSWTFGTNDRYLDLLLTDCVELS